MWIVAVAWVYVVALMAATEPSIVHGLMTFLCYCVLPLSLVFYLTGSKRRRARRAALAQKDGAGAVAADTAAPATAKNAGCAVGGPDGRSDGGSCDADGGGDGGGGGGD